MNYHSNSWVLIGLAGFGFISLTKLTWTAFKKYLAHRKAGDVDELKRKQALLDLRRPPEIWNTVYIFPDKHPEDPASSVNRLIKLISEAEVKIQISIYILSFQPFEVALAKKHNDGLIVQIVTDYDTLTSNGRSKLISLMNRGVEVKCKAMSENNLMHHKFVIIDDEVVFTGSLNWTRAGTKNWENVLVTTNPRHVEPYKRAFRAMWKEFDDAADVLRRDRRS